MQIYLDDGKISPERLARIKQIARATARDKINYMDVTVEGEHVRLFSTVAMGFCRDHVRRGKVERERVIYYGEVHKMLHTAGKKVSDYRFPVKLHGRAWSGMSMVCSWFRPTGRRAKGKGVKQTFFYDNEEPDLTAYSFEYFLGVAEMEHNKDTGTYTLSDRTVAGLPRFTVLLSKLRCMGPCPGKKKKKTKKKKKPGAKRKRQSTLPGAAKGNPKGTEHAEGAVINLDQTAPVNRGKTKQQSMSSAGKGGKKKAKCDGVIDLDKTAPVSKGRSKSKSQNQGKGKSKGKGKC